MFHSLAEILPFTASMFGDKTAVVTDTRQLSFRDLDRLSAALSNRLAKQGLIPGDRVTLYGPNSWQWIVGYFAAFKAGAIVNPINALLTPTEADYILQDCQASFMLAAPEKIEALSGLEGARSLKSIIALSEDFLDIEARSRRRSSLAAKSSRAGSGNDISTICYTSGTTGYPKGALQSHRAVLTNAYLTALMHERTAGDVIVSALPLPHVYGNVVMVSALMAGATLVLHSKFEAGAILASIEQHRATMLEGVPTMYMYLLDYPGLKGADMSSLRCCTVGGQSMAPAKMRAVEAALGCPLIELWGMTELAGLGTTFAASGPCEHGSIGVPLPYVQVSIIDVDDGRRLLNRGEVGELIIRSPTQMTGYHNQPEATRAAIDKDGWLHTGDVACIDDNGYVYLLDRKTDMIITAGYNIYPAEVERVILEHPDVVMAAVGAISDDQKGELAKAYIVSRSGAEIGADAIVEFCRARLAAYKVPRAVQFVSDLPKTSTGKILRRKLRDLDALAGSHRSARAS